MMRSTQLKRPRALCPARRLRGEESAQSLVEFVLALPILLVLIFGIVEFAAAWRTFQVVTNVAREGARLGVIANAPPDAQIRAHIDSLLVNGNLNLANRTVTLTCNGNPGLCSGTTATGQPDEVQVDYLHAFVVLGPVLDLMCAGCGTSYGTVTLSSRSVMRNE